MKFDALFGLFFVGTFLTNLNSVVVGSGNAKDFLTLSSKEKQKLDQFRHNVVPILEHDFMKEEIYLLRILRETDFNLVAAEKLLKNVLQWREENGIENIVDEEFPEFDEEYNVFIEGCDPQNRPVISIPIGDWDIRKAILAGLGPQLFRYIDKIFEDSTIFLRNANAAGMELVQATLILDLSGFSAVTHGCPRCLELYIYFLTTLQTHFPGIVEKLYFVNTPDVFTLLWNSFNRIFTPKLREITTMFGRDKDVWGPQLRNLIGADQLSTRYGGDKSEALEFYYIRQAGGLISSPQQIISLNMTNECGKDVAIYEELIREVHHETGWNQKQKERGGRSGWDKKECSKRAGRLNAGRKD